MGLATPVLKDASGERTFRAASGFRIIPRIETYPGIISFVQTPLGKTVLLASFALGLRFLLPDLRTELGVMFPIALVTFFPDYRRFALAVTPLVLVFYTGADALAKSATLAVIATGTLLYAAVMRWPKSAFARRPVTYLLASFSTLIALASLAPAHTISYALVWALVGATATYFWFICYALTDRSSNPAKDSTLQLASFRPLWGSTATPFPKGAAYLRRIEAKNPEQLAVAQLKGLKLLVWAILLSAFAGLWNWSFHTWLQIPTAAQALTLSIQGKPAAWHLRWESLILYFFETILSMSVMGHQIIALCRLAGFNALRNTCKPLASTTISEFFNRFYYYFKELLVDFFFYPAFIRYFKRSRRLRTAFATFAAAFFGNAFYHFTRDWQVVRDAGFWRAATSFEAYLLYCLLLSAGLTISQLKTRGPRPSGILRRQILPSCGVALFYCLINVFEIGARDVTLGSYMKYFAGLFFIRL